MLLLLPCDSNISYFKYILYGYIKRKNNIMSCIKFNKVIICQLKGHHYKFNDKNYIYNELIFFSGNSLECWEDLDNFMQSTLDSHYYCKLCHKFKHKGRRQVRVHIEAVHFRGTFVHNCQYCQEPFDCKKTLENHIYTTHRPMRTLK